MKTHIWLPTSILVSVALLGAMKMRKVEVDKEERLKRFRDIRLRVTVDVLEEYGKQIKLTQMDVDDKQKDLNQRKDVFEQLTIKALQVKADLDACLGEQKTFMDELATAETDLTYQRAHLIDEETSWRREAAQLEQQLAGVSLVCSFLRPDAQSVRHLCDGAKAGGDANRGQPGQKDEALKIKQARGAFKEMGPKAGNAI